MAKHSYLLFNVNVINVCVSDFRHAVRLCRFWCRSRPQRSC